MRSGNTSLIIDMLFVLPGWLLLLLIDPWTATLAGIPAGAMFIALRRTWWHHRPITGGIIALVLMPFFALFVTTFAVFGSSGPMLGIFLAAAAFAVVEGWNRRFDRSLIHRFPLATAVLFTILALLFNALALEGRVTSYPTEDFIKSLSRAPDPPSWSLDAKMQAAEAVQRAIAQDVTSREKAAQLHYQLAENMDELVAAENPRGVYVTLYKKNGYRARGYYRNGDNALDNLITAAADAIAKKPRKARSARTNPRIWRGRKAGTRIQIDVIGPSRKITYRPLFYLFEEQFRSAHRSLKKIRPLGRLFNLAYEVEPGVDGLEIRKKGAQGMAVMLPAEPVTQGWATPRVRSAPAKIRNMMKRAWSGQFGQQLDLDAGGFTVSKFRSTSFGQLRAGEKIVDWFRGNVLLKGELTRDKLIERTILAADWLSRQVKRTEGTSNQDRGKGAFVPGRFHYEIYPPYRGGTRDYNLPRHAGSTYGLFAIFRASLREPKLREAGQRALDAGLLALEYVKSSLGSPAPKEATSLMCFMDKRGKATSGATALAAMAVAELPDPEEIENEQLTSRVTKIPKEKWLRGMGACMLLMIDPKGAVFRNYDEAKKNKSVKKEPLYFPGEVMLALVRMYKQLGDEQFLEGAKRIGDRQLRLYSWFLSLDWPHPGDHWIIQALDELSRATKNRDYAELSVLMGRGYVREQYPPQEYIYPDYRGAYRRVADLPRTTRAASRGEALGGAMSAARFLGSDSSQFESALTEGARHLIEQQFTVENSHFIPEQYDVEGGIRMGLVDNHLRIDNNQHSIVALLKALKAME